MVATASSPPIPPTGWEGGARRQPPRTLSMPLRASRRSISASATGDLPVPAARDPISLPRKITSPLYEQ